MLNPAQAGERVQDLGLFLEFDQLADRDDNRSAVLRDSTVRGSSSGMFRRLFGTAAPGDPADTGRDAADMPEFSLAGLNVRQVTIRNTPTIINAAYFPLQFWDGRAEKLKPFTRGELLKPLENWFFGRR